MTRKVPHTRNPCEHNWIPIVYGYPSKTMTEQAANKEIKLGGCIIRDTNPLHFCTKCELRK